MNDLHTASHPNDPLCESRKERRAALVLVLTDEDSTCEEVLRALRSLPCVAIASRLSDGGKALDGAHGRPSLVIIEGPTPSNTAECIRSLRATDPNRRHAILALTTSDDPSTEACLQAGCNGIVPIDGLGGRSGAVAVAARYWLTYNLPPPE